MARRMVNTKIINNDQFLEMGASARLLYYDLLVRADDDGFITPLGVVRMTGAAIDDLKVLIAKKFIFQWNDGVIVLLHWREHNHVKNDRYISSDYSSRLKDVDGLYTLGARKSLGTKRIQNGSKSVPQDRLGKDSINKKKIKKKNPTSPEGLLGAKTQTPDAIQCLAYFKEKLGRIGGSKIRHENALNMLLKKFSASNICQQIDVIHDYRSQPYWPSVYSFYDLLNKNEAIKSAYKRANPKEAGRRPDQSLEDFYTEQHIPYIKDIRFGVVKTSEYPALDKKYQEEHGEFAL